MQEAAESTPPGARSAGIQPHGLTQDGAALSLTDGTRRPRASALVGSAVCSARLGLELPSFQPAPSTVPQTQNCPTWRGLGHWFSCRAVSQALQLPLQSTVPGELGVDR